MQTTTDNDLFGELHSSSLTLPHSMLQPEIPSMALLARPQVKFDFQIYLRGEVTTLMWVIDEARPARLLTAPNFVVPQRPRNPALVALMIEGGINSDLSMV